MIKHLKYIVVLAGILVMFNLSSVGNFIVTERNEIESDYLLFLVGTKEDRALEIYDLVKGNDSLKVLIIKEATLPGAKFFYYNKEYASRAEVSIALMVDLGIKRDRIILIPGNSRNTKDEAQTINKYLAEKNINSLTIVTSNYHSKRARWIFGRVLDDSVKFTVIPSKYSKYNPEKWWKSLRDSQIMLLEYMKMCYFFVYALFI